MNKVYVMLLLVTLFASLCLVSSGPRYKKDRSNKKAPSAHLEGGVSAATDYSVDQVITAWNTEDPKSHLLGKFEYADGRMRVPKNGRYYVYMQMYFNSRSHNNNNRVALYADDRILLMIHKDMSAGQENTGFAGGVFEFQKGEEIYVKVIGFNTKIWLGPNHCYFGAYLI